MNNFNPLKFIADNAELSLADAIKKAYEQGKKDAESHWMPCSERMPKEKQKILLSTEDLYYRMGEQNTGVIEGWRYGGIWYTYSAKGLDTVHYVKAWQPLPELWRGEEE